MQSFFLRFSFSKVILLFLIGVLAFGIMETSAYAEYSNIPVTPSGIKLTELEQKIDQFIAPYIGHFVPGAAIVVTQGSELIFSKGYGYGNIEKKVPIDPIHTVFEYGSINKTFVWTAVMQLVEQGKMKLDQDIKTYLPPAFASKLKYNKPITLLNIMNHTAGFEEFTFGTVVSSPDQLDSLPDALLSSEPKQTYEPGTVISYSNFATSLAAYAVESVSGETFANI